MSPERGRFEAQREADGHIVRTDVETIAVVARGKGHGRSGPAEGRRGLGHRTEAWHGRRLDGERAGRRHEFEVVAQRIRDQAVGQQDEVSAGGRRLFLGDGSRAALSFAPQILPRRQKRDDLVDLAPAHCRFVANRVRRHLLQHRFEFGLQVTARRCLPPGPRDLDVPFAGEQAPPLDQGACRFLARGEAVQRGFRQIAIPSRRQNRPCQWIRHHDLQAAGGEKEVQLPAHRLGKLKHRPRSRQRHVDIDERLPAALRPRDGLDLDVLSVDPKLQLTKQVPLRSPLRLERHRLLA